MSENSAFWEGHTTGDAASLTGWDAPYTSNDMRDLFAHIFTNYSSEGFVVPEYEDELLVHSNSPDDLTVLIEAGSAFVCGRIYELTDTEELAISSNVSGNPRLDRVILRITYATQTTRIVILEGTPGAVPALPTLTQDAATYEISLANVWVAAGTSAISEEEIHDERLFLFTCETLNKSFGSPNEVVNSELMAFRIYAPSKWLRIGTQTGTSNAAPSQMSRGRSLEIENNASGEAGTSQAVRIKASTTYAIKALVKGVSGDLGYFVVTTNSFAPSTVTRNIRRTSDWYEELIYYTTEADATTLTVSYQTGTASGDKVNCAQVLVCEGYYPGDFRQIHEFILDPITQLGWEDDDYSTESVTWDMSTDFGTVILDNTKSIYFRIGSGDSAGAAAGETGAYVTTLGGSDYWVSSVNYNINDLYGQVSSGEVMLINRQFDVDYVASGVDTLASDLRIVGVRI